MIVEAVQPSADQFLLDVVAGLTSSPKRLPSKYFYDRRGSELFERICGLPEYYLTRTELKIVREHVADMAGKLGPRCLLIEPGSGSSLKVRLLLSHLTDAAAYVPVDISCEHMKRWAASLDRDFPRLAVLPVHADFSGDFAVPPVAGARRRVFYFPGSTIGNFSPLASRGLLERWGRVAGPGGGLLIGVDLKKDVAILEAAYNDREGVTREFNLNMLSRIRDELDADIRPDSFEHRAHYNEAEGRIEMHLVSRSRQTVHLDHTTVTFEPGETIHTENSYKFDLEQFRALAAAAGWEHVACWTDDDEYFSVMYFERS